MKTESKIKLTDTSGFMTFEIKDMFRERSVGEKKEQAESAYSLEESGSAMRCDITRAIFRRLGIRLIWRSLFRASPILYPFSE